MNEYPDRKYECCRHEENMVEVAEADKGRLTDMKRCRECGRRHMHVHLEPGKFGLRATPLGER